MVAVVSGNGLGLINTSLTQLGTLFGGQAGIGQSGASQMVNIATGNLIIQDTDDSLDVRGFDTTFLRTYNSEAQLSDVGQDGFVTGYERYVTLNGTLNAVGSTVTLATGDGQKVVFTYSGTANKYVASVGGALDTMTWTGGTTKTWTYLDPSAQRQEVYADATDPVLKGRLLSIRDLASDGTTPMEFDVIYDSYNRVQEVRSVDGSSNVALSDAIMFTYNGTSTQLTGVSTQSGGVLESQVTYGYDSFGRLSYVQTDLTPTNTADNTWNTTTPSANDGKLYRTTYTYAAQTASNLQIASVSTSDGVTVGYTYNTNGTIQSVTQGSAADGSLQTLTFGYLVGSTTVTDGAGHVWTYQFDSSDRLTAVLEPQINGLRQQTLYTYNANNEVTRISQLPAAGQAALLDTIYQYDANGNRILARDLSGNTTTWTYNTSDQVLTQTQYTTADPNGLDPTVVGIDGAAGALTTNYVYDPQNRLVFVVGATGDVTQYTYATSGNGVGQMASARHYTGATYASTMTQAALTNWTTNATAMRAASSTLTTYSYDIKGRLQQTIAYADVTADVNGSGVLDAGAAITNYTYNAQGQLLEQISVHGSTRSATVTPSGSTVTDYVYDGMGRLLSVLTRDSATTIPTDANSLSTTYAYIDSGHQIQVSYDSGMVQTQLSNAAGEVVSVSQVGMVDSTQVTRTTQMYYDNTGVLRASQDATGAMTYYFYDNDGRLVDTVDGTGAVTRTVYDGIGRAVQTVDYVTTVNTSGWLSAGTPPTVQPFVNVSTLVYAATAPVLTAGQAWVQTSSLIDRHNYITYDASGRLQTQTDAAGLVTTYAYDGASRPTSVTVAMPGDTTDAPRVTSYYYDNAGRQVGVVDAAGYLTESVYDDAGRLVRTIRYATLATVSSSGWPAQRPATSANDAITQLYYDGRSQVIGELDYVGGTASTGTGYLTTYVYDQQANQRATNAYGTLLTGLTSTSTLATLQAAAVAGTGGVRTTKMNYNGLGQLITSVNAEGTVTGYIYDEAGRLVQTNTDQGQSDVRETFDRYDAFGNLIGELSGVQATQAAASAMATYGKLLTDPTLTGAQLDGLYGAYGTTYSYDLVGRRIQSTDAQGNMTWYVYDAGGRQTFEVRGMANASGVQNAQGEVTETVYNAFGQATSQIAYTGRITIPTPGSLASVLTLIGAMSPGSTDTQEQLSYNVRGELAQYTNGNGVVTTDIYTVFGQLQQQKLAAVGTTPLEMTQYTYDQRGLETSEIDGVGTSIARTVSQTYDAFGRVVTSTDALGTVTSYSYDRMGRQLSRSEQVTAEGVLRTEAWSSTYDAYGRTLTQTDALGNPTIYAYSDASKSVTVTTAEGVVMTSVHNAFGQTVQVTTGVGTPDAGTTSYVYDANGELSTTTDADNGVSSNFYDVRGLLILTTDATGRNVAYTYDAAGRVLTRTVDPDTVTNPNELNLTTTYTYDGQGRAIQTVDPTGRTTVTAYDNEGEVLSVTQDPNGLDLVTTYTWDGSGHELSVTQGSGSTVLTTTNYTYDALNRRISQTVDPGGAGHLNLTTKYAYDANDNLISVTDPLRLVTYFSYDEANRLRFTVDPAGDVSEIDYDADGRIAQTRSYATAATGITSAQTVAQMRSLIATQALANAAVDPIEYRVYDADGNLNYSIDGLGDVSQVLYDSADRRIGTRSYATAISAANMTALATKLSNGTAKVTDINPSTVLTVDNIHDLQNYQVLDAAGRVRFTINAVGDVTEIRYDAAGRAVEQLNYATPIALGTLDLAALKAGTLAAGTVTARTTAGSGSVAAYITSTQTAAAHASYQVYDAAGRVAYTVTASQIGGVNAGTVTQNAYDGSGLLIERIQYANTVAFDPTQTVNSAALLALSSGSTSASDRATNYVYDAAGRLRFTLNDLGNVDGTVDSYTVSEQRYDAAGHVVMTFDYGTMVKPSAFTESALEAAVTGIADTRQTTYAYDAAGRLTSTTDALNQTESYGYDADGNRTSLTNKLGNIWTYKYDAAGRQIEIDTPPVAVLTFNSSWGVVTTMQAVVTKIGYDALGNVISRTEDATGGASARTTQYVYDARGNQIETIFPDAGEVVNGVLVATPGGSAPTIQITYNALDQAVVQQDVRGNYTYKVYNQQGLLAYDIDADGYVTGYTYDALGEQTGLTRYATALNTTTSAFTTASWSAGQPISLAQVVSGVTTNMNNRTIANIYDVEGNKTSVVSSSVGYTLADGTTGTGSPTTLLTYDAYGEVVQEAVLLQNAEGSTPAQWAYSFHYYDDLGRKTMDVDADGYVTAYTYTARGDVASETDYARALSATTFAAMIAAPSSTPPPAPGAGDETTGFDRITQYTYDALGRKASQTSVAVHYQDSSGTQGLRNVTTAYGYDAVNDLTTTDIDGETTTTTFDALGRTIAIEQPVESILAANYNSQLTGASGASVNLTNTPALYVQSSPYTTIGYDAFGNAVQVRRSATGWVQGSSTPPPPSSAGSTNPDQVQTTQYDYQGRAVIVQDAAGNLSYRTYDAADNLIQVTTTLTGNAGRWATVRTVATYDAVNQQTLTEVFRDLYTTVGSTTTSQGTVTDQIVQVRYNAFGEITSKGDSANPTATLEAQYSYDAAGRMIGSNAQGGVPRTYGYNLAGYQITESNQVTTGFNTNGTAINTTAVTTQVNDALGRVIQTTLPAYDSAGDTSTVAQTLDRWGNVIQLVDPRGYVTNTQYNQFNQKILETQPLVQVVDGTGTSSWQRPQVSWYYDALGRQVGTQDANGNLSQTVYDAAGRQIETIDAMGNATTQAYDAFGQQTLTQNAMGYITWQNHDLDGRVIAQGDYLPSGATRTNTAQQTYTLNQNGDRIATTDAMNATILDDYDSRDLLIRSQTAMGVVMSYTYDANGNKASSTDGLGTTQTWTTDYFGRTTDHVDLSGRDNKNAYNAVSGELTGQTTNDATSPLRRSIAYYANGQVAQITETQTGGVTSAYQYDAAGNRTVEETTSSDGTGTALHVVTTSVYDSHNRVQNVVQDDLISGLRTFDLSYGYDAQGNRTEVVATSGYGTNTTPISTVALPPVVVAAPAAVTLRGGIPVSFAIRASDVFRDPQGSPLAIGVQQLVGGVAQALPTWLTYTMDSTGQLIFSASAGSEASLHQTLTMQLSATDGAGNVVTSNFTVMVVVNSAPRAIAGAPTILLTQPGQPWEAEFDAATYFTDPDVGDTMTLTATVGGGTPSWMTIDPGNPAALRLSGAAPVAGTYTITLRATDAAGAATTQTITLYVATDIAPTVATTIPAQTTNQGQSWLFSIPQGTFADLEGYVLTSSATGMPPGVSFDPASGTFSGTPTASGTFTINVTATDPQGMSVTTPFTLIVANQAPYVNVPLTDQLIPVGVGWTYTIPPGSFMDPNGDPLTYTATLQGGAALPSWISFNAASQKFTGTPPDAEQDTIVVTAADNHGNTVTDQFVMTSGPATPVLQNNLPDLAASFTVPFSYQIPAGTFSDPWNGTLTYTIGNASSLPPEIALSSTGLLTGSLHAVDSGSYNVQIVVSNSYGGSATTTLTIDYTGMPGGNGGGGGRQIQVQQFTLATPQVVTPQVSVLRQQVAWYTYDADNRVSIFDGIRIPKQTVNGVTTPAYIALSPSGGSSYQQFYDAAGHLLDTETYVYDPTTDVDTLAVTQTVLDLRGDVLATYLPQEVTNNHLPATTTTQTFDADGRLLSTFNYFPPGWIYTYPDGEGEPVVVKVGGMLESATTYSYDADGRITYQTSYQRPYGDSTGQNANGGTSSYPTWILNLSGDQYGNIGVLAMTSQVSYVNTNGSTNLGYDAAGRVKGYTYFNVNDGTSGSTETFLSTYTGYDTWLEATVAGSSTNANDDPTTSTIHYDAAGREVSIDENTPTVNGVTIPDTWRFFTNDGDGQILRRRDGTEPQGGGTFTQPTDTPSLQAANTHMVYANGQEVASMDESGEIDAISHVTAFANSMIGTTQVVVGDNDTLQSLAQRVYGDASLWYVLAAANGLSATATLTSGTTLEAPQVTTNTNDASTFKPYNPSDITGPNAPSLPDIPPPAQNNCNPATMIMAIISAVVVAVLAPELAPMMSTFFGGTTIATGVFAGSTLGGVAAAGFVAGAAGSVLSQAVGSGLGLTHFSWKQVGVAAVSTAITLGSTAGLAGSATFGAVSAEGVDILNPLGAAVEGGISYAGSVVGDALVGQPAHFSWAAVAGSVVGSMASNALAEQPEFQEGGSLPGNIAMNSLANFANGAVDATTMRLLGKAGPQQWGQIAADAFGNGLGNAIGGEVDEQMRQAQLTPAQTFALAATPTTILDQLALGASNGGGSEAMSAQAVAQSSAVAAIGAGGGATTPVTAGTIFGYPTYTKDVLDADASKASEEQINSWNYYKENSNVIPVEIGAPPLSPSDTAGLYTWNTNIINWRANPDQQAFVVQGVDPSALQQDAAASAANQGSSDNFADGFRGQFDVGNFSFGDVAANISHVVSDGGNKAIFAAQTAYDVVTDSQSRYQVLNAISAEAFHPIDTYNGLKSATADFYGMSASDQATTLGEAGMAFLATAGVPAGAGKVLSYVGDVANTLRATSSLSEGFDFGMGDAGYVPREVPPVSEIAEPVGVGGGSVDIAAVDDPVVAQAAEASQVRVAEAASGESVGSVMAEGEASIGMNDGSGIITDAAETVGSGNAPGGGSLILRPVQIEFPASGLSEGQQQLFSAHLTEQQTTLNRLSLTRTSDLELNIQNYPNIQSQIANSRRLARGYLTGSGDGLDAAHALDAVAGGYVNEFSGFRDPIQQRIGALWRTRVDQIVPGSEHLLVPIFGE